MERMTEQELVSIYRATIREVYAFVARRTGGDPRCAEDFVQETYLRALSDWSRRGVPQKPSAWLKTVARNLIVSHYRKIMPSSLDAADMGGPDLRCDLDRMEDRALVYWGLSKLNRRRAELLEAFHFDGLSVRQIADQSGVSERAVEGRLRRAREALKEKIQDLLRGRSYEHNPQS